MKLTEFLRPENIHQGVMLSSKKRVLEYIGKLVAESYNFQCQITEYGEGVCPVECFGNLFKREKLGSTSINHGIAIPHAKLPNNAKVSLEKPIAIFLQLDTPIDYEASDNKDVDLVYAIMFPENSCQQYKGALAEIAQKLSDKTLAKQLRLATTAEEIWQLLDQFDNTIEQH